ncbi:hypothetical protein BANRA_05577 [Escherichia coli]|nr:hypothetical protein BANRA_05577 [Escherichia coli]
MITGLNRRLRNELCRTRKLRADVAEVANTMCDLRARLNDMEHRCRFDSDVLVERLTRQTLYRANRLFMEAYTEILELDSCFKD